MRSLYNPGKIISSILSPIASIFSPPKAPDPTPAPVVAADEKAKADKAAADAAAAEREQSRQRAGGASTMVAAPADISLLGTRRRSLLGGR